jgi:hypothetical protein
VSTGRDLELLVATLEHVVAGTPVVVQSPELIMGRRSGTWRQVDVTVRGRFGSTDMLLAFECRDRSSTPGVQWIDELVGKRQDIDADRVIAVSANGFTAPAVVYAETVGVELRRVTDTTARDVYAWMGGGTVELWAVELLLHAFEVFPKVALSVRQAAALSAACEAVSAKSPCFHFPPPRAVQSVWGYLRPEILPRLVSSAKRAAWPTRKWLVASYAGDFGGQTPWFETSAGSIVIDGYATGIYFWVDRGDIDLAELAAHVEHRRYDYVGPSGTLSENVEYVLQTDSEGELILTVHAVRLGDKHHFKMTSYVRAPR